ncbi:ricin B-like lectin [Dioszegia hungarica]|uniref:Ricin B-like lectin n=1 Tax=Dioszegia hungarica TaxID=4972 RepID=A0AA38LV11_9TREE|nr:ricin B-like lectin [Dioszegia hungarica]KAI9636615.1 ricin B-like lectin [Dioszegia hungarica]
MLAQLFALLPLLALVSATPIHKRDGTLIRSGRDGQCLALEGLPGVQRYGLVKNGTPVITRDCLGANTWFINRGSGSITIPGTNFALDIGLNPGNNGALKVWESYPGSPQQTWYLTDDNRIAQTGGNQCLDEGDNGVQTYQCTTGNTNQVWYIDDNSSAPTTTVSPTTSSAAPSSTAAPSGNPFRIVFGNDQCLLTTGSDTPDNGTPVVVAPCSSYGAKYFTRVGNQLQLSGTNYCLDAGTNPHDGVAMKLWQCGNYPQQQFIQQGPLLVTANEECLDVKADEPSVLQTWHCSAQDPQQAFTFA